MSAYLSPAQVCELAPGLTESKLKTMRYRRQGPAFLKPTEKTVLYREADVLAWIESSEIKPGGVS